MFAPRVRPLHDRERSSGRFLWPASFLMRRIRPLALARPRARSPHGDDGSSGLFLRLASTLIRGKRPLAGAGPLRAATRGAGVSRDVAVVVRRRPCHRASG
ncbi:hypothetical protein Csp2054_16595 [Curtobacterium sp. 'Ferrero']|nr:hypothetical protein Csp2054_16595 [Curtobacterium sp. 'Ferrero']